MAAAAAAQSSTAAEPPIRDERTALTDAADLVVARWSLFDGQRTVMPAALVPVGARRPPGRWRCLTRRCRHCSSCSTISRRSGRRFIRADIFEWVPDRRYDVVFFGFWLSHVPPS